MLDVPSVPWVPSPLFSTLPCASGDFLPLASLGLASGRHAQCSEERGEGLESFGSLPTCVPHLARSLSLRPQDPSLGSGDCPSSWPVRPRRGWWFHGG